jgi:hypothetical protein
MTYSRTIGRTLVATIAAATITAPTALAVPRHGHASAAEVSARTARQSARADRRLPGPPTWPAHPQPIATPAAAHPGGDQGPVIALGITGLLALGGIAGVANHSRRARRHVTA